MKRTPNKHSTLIKYSPDDEFWIDDNGCLQPCPVCGDDDTRDNIHNVAHPLCWTTMTGDKRQHFSALQEELLSNRDRDRYDDDE
jgi:hypothetical protein